MLQIKISEIFYRNRPKIVWFKELLKHDKGIDPASNDASSSGTRTTDEERALNRDHELGGNGKTEVSELNQ